jgi:hypothetical protein
MSEILSGIAALLIVFLLFGGGITIIIRIFIKNIKLMRQKKNGTIPVINTKMKKSHKIFVALILTFSIIVIAYEFFPDQLLIWKAENVIRTNLRSPSQANFIYSKVIIHHKNIQYLVFTTVDAPNAFNVMLRNNYFVIIDKSKGETFVEEASSEHPSEMEYALMLQKYFPDATRDELK